MRRGILVLSGILSGGLMLLLLCTSVSAQYTREAPQQLRLPCPVEDSQLTAVMLASYDGPFWEDGSDEEVMGVAALVVENNSGLFVEQGAVILESGGENLVFEVMALPPDQQVLVLEKDRKPYAPSDGLQCYGWVKNAYPENPGMVSVTPHAMGVFTVTNNTSALLQQVRVYFKNYDSDSGMYIGGRVYMALVEDLQPGEVRQVSPYHYAQPSSRVVTVTVEISGYP